MHLLESAFALLLATSTNPNARDLKQLGDLSTPPFPMDFLADDIIVTTTTTSSPGWPPSTTNLLYLRKYGFYIEFANAIAGVGILSDRDHLFVQFTNLSRHESVPLGVWHWSRGRVSKHYERNEQLSLYIQFELENERAVEYV